MTAVKTSKYSREFVPGIHWIWGCHDSVINGELLHASESAYAIVGADAALLFDTGAPRHWPEVSKALDEILEDRPLDWLVPSHTEVPHSGNLGRLLEKYPTALVVGDVRDYHTLYPEFESRLLPYPKYSPIELGGGYRVTLIDALIKDLPASQWAYEGHEETLFVSDAFNYRHYPSTAELDEPVHLPGDCGLLSSELPKLPKVHHAMASTRLALGWTRYMDTGPVLDEFITLMHQLPTQYVAPTHGNVISDFDQMLPIMRQAYNRNQTDPVITDAPTGRGVKVAE